MKSEMTQAMEVVAPRILEEAVFLFSEPLECDQEPGDDWSPVGVELGWDGPSAGVMRIWADRSLRPLLAANMLGIEEDDPVCQAKGMDALKEILNMIVGNCLTEAWGPGPVFNLAIPSTVENRVFGADRIDGVWLSLEGKPALLWCGA